MTYFISGILMVISFAVGFLCGITAFAKIVMKEGWFQSGQGGAFVYYNPQEVKIIEEEIMKEDAEAKE